MHTSILEKLEKMNSSQLDQVNLFCETVLAGTHEKKMLSFCRDKCKMPDIYSDDELNSVCRECELRVL